MLRRGKRAGFCFVSLVAVFAFVNKVNIFGLAGNLLVIELFLSFYTLGQRSLSPPVSHSVEPSPYGATLSPSNFQARSQNPFSHARGTHNHMRNTHTFCMEGTRPIKSGFAINIFVDGENGDVSFVTWCCRCYKQSLWRWLPGEQLLQSGRG